MIIETEERCPEQSCKSVGDESYEWCTLVDKPCLLRSGMVCDEWEEIKE